MAGVAAIVALPRVAGYTEPAIIPILPGDTRWLVASLVLVVMLVILSAIDLDVRRLPDILTWPLLAAGLTHAIVAGGSASLAWHGAGALLGYAALWALARLYDAYRGRSGLGLGDAKLAAAGGAWVGLEGLPTSLLAATLVALAAVAGAALFGKKVTLATAIPFGPFLALGIWMVWLYGPLFASV